MSKKPKVTAEAFLKKCFDECCDKLDNPRYFSSPGLQKNALRVEAFRDMSPRCGLQATSPGLQADIDKRGWGMWIHSGGDASAFLNCDTSKCPKKDWFLRTAPWKHLRDLSGKDAPKSRRSASQPGRIDELWHTEKGT